MKQKLKLALVGAGERGQYCYAPYAKMHGYEIEFVGVADPHKGRREKFVQDYHVPAEGVFETAEQFFARPRMADAVLICTQDSQHYAYACQAIDLGYSILLEKPISPSVRECLDLQRRAEEKGTQIMVCHVMRYTKFYRKLKELIDSGVIGDVVHVTHTENVAYWHYAHSYVRGNWHKTADSSPMILAKCCHDMDILSWLLGSRCRTVSSFGDLRYFREEYLNHVVDHHCPVCNGRKRRLEIKPELCKGCGKCARNCPMEAISGQPRTPYVIDNEKCIHCGACWGACPFGAIDAIEEEG